MKMLDVNILVYAHREESVEHKKYNEWLTDTFSKGEEVAISETAASGFIRVVTNPKIFRPPSTLSESFSFLSTLFEQENCTILRPGEQHFEIYKKLCFDCKATGKLSSDAYHAALAIEFGCTWVTADSDFVRFEKYLNWQHL